MFGDQYIKRSSILHVYFCVIIWISFSSAPRSTRRIAFREMNSYFSHQSLLASMSRKHILGHLLVERCTDVSMLTQLLNSHFQTKYLQHWYQIPSLTFIIILDLTQPNKCNNIWNKKFHLSFICLEYLTVFVFSLKRIWESISSDWSYTVIKFKWHAPTI